jgi:hypothetical protein
MFLINSYSIIIEYQGCPFGINIDGDKQKAIGRFSFLVFYGIGYQIIKYDPETGMIGFKRNIFGIIDLENDI